MKSIKLIGFPFLLIIYMLITTPFQSCDPDDDDECDTCNIVYKPNIYIYPNEKTELTVTIDFPLGGNIVASIPEYLNGWNITVDTNGLIDNTYSYLFYESNQPDIWQKTAGWTIQNAELELFFRENMAKYGFYGQEIDDFVDYWIPRLTKYPFYSIYPQTSELIDKVIILDFSKQPDSVLRLFYVIKGQNILPDKLVEPIIDSFNREGYFVTEWGVVLK